MQGPGEVADDFASRVVGIVQDMGYIAPPTQESHSALRWFGPAEVDELSQEEARVLADRSAAGLAAEGVVADPRPVVAPLREGLREAMRTAARPGTVAVEDLYPDLSALGAVLSQSEADEVRRWIDRLHLGFETYTADADMAPLFKGLPDNRCQCPHWGYVIKGKLVYHYASGDDIITTGEGYYARPGHTPEIFAGTEISSSARRPSWRRPWRSSPRTWRLWGSPLRLDAAQDAELVASGVAHHDPADVTLADVGSGCAGGEEPFDLLGLRTTANSGVTARPTVPTRSLPSERSPTPSAPRPRSTNCRSGPASPRRPRTSRRSYAPRARPTRRSCRFRRW